MELPGSVAGQVCPEGARSAAEPDRSQARLHPVQFDLLAPERQRTLWGGLEPLEAPAPAAEPPPELELEPEQQGRLFGPPQLPLPLPTIHKREGGKVPKSCRRGFVARIDCAHHPELVLVTQTCARQRCEASAEANALERARDAWEGTADEEADRLALRHFGDVPWGVFVWTVPAELRALCVGERLRKFRKAAWEMTLEVVRLAAGSSSFDFYGRSYLHPVGDGDLAELEREGFHPQGDGEDYKPHENVLVPLLAFHRHRKPRRLRFVLPEAWLGAGGWVQERWRERLVGLFGQWWPREAAPPVVVWHYGFATNPAKKVHALKYFGRVFAGWARHPDVPLRPRAVGLAHWKRRDDLERVLQGIAPEADWKRRCAKCTAAGEEPAESFSVASEELELARDRCLAMQATHVCEGCAPDRGREAAAAGRPYLEHRRIMGATRGADPPATGPPPTPAGVRPGPTAEDLAAWARFMGAQPAGGPPEVHSTLPERGETACAL